MPDNGSGPFGIRCLRPDAATLNPSGVVGRRMAFPARSCGA
jgi:hypothetical protein